MTRLLSHLRSRAFAEIVLPFVLSVLFLALSPAGRAVGAELMPVTLKTDVTVAGAEIRLSDLFDIEDEAAAILVAPAPAPGERALLYPSRIQEVARQHGLHWANPEGLQRVAVTRASQVVPMAEILAALEPQLAAELGTERVEVEFSPRDLVLRVALDDETRVALETLSLDHRTGRFEARLRPGAAPAADLVAVAGRAYALVRVPVPARAVASGEILRERDLQWIEMRADRLAPMTVTKADDLIGREARRPLRVATPVRVSDVMEPIVVARNQIVALVFEAPGIRLTDRGRALEDAAAHDSVRVMNLTSNRVVTGFAAPSGEVLVGPALPQLASR